MSGRFHFSPKGNKADQINWREWSKETLEEAHNQNKPIILDISAVWCHWCHVMDETSYSDEKNINFINKEFIPVRVDSDRRPDINNRYNMGGWPTTAFLTPNGKVITGATYLPPDELHSALQSVSKFYRENMDKLESETSMQKKQPPSIKIEPGRLSNEKGVDILRQVLRSMIEDYDLQFGGFGRAPKFPHVSGLRFLLLHYFRNRKQSYEEMLMKTLENMANRGMYDKEAGGFFRYSTTADWSIPHYEKMLEDNAGLLRTYLEAYQILNRPKFKEVVENTLAYIISTLCDMEQGLFFGSQDADEHFYKLSKEERKNRRQPFVDKTIYTEWNAMMLSSCLHVGLAMIDDEMTQLALRGISSLYERCFIEDFGMCHYYDGEPHLPEILIDQVQMLMALLDAYETTGEKGYIRQAERLGGIMYARFWDQEQGGFFDDISELGLPSNNLSRTKSIEHNGISAEALLRLAEHSGKAGYRLRAEEILKMFHSEVARYGYFASSYARAVDLYIHGFTKINIVGELESLPSKEMLRACFETFVAHRFIKFMDISRDTQEIIENGYEGKPGEAKAYICVAGQCLPPITDPAAVIGELQNRKNLG